MYCINYQHGMMSILTKSIGIRKHFLKVLYAREAQAIDKRQIQVSEMWVMWVGGVKNEEDYIGCLKKKMG